MQGLPTPADKAKPPASLTAAARGLPGNVAQRHEQHRVFDVELLGEARSQRHVHLRKRAARMPAA